MIYVIAGSGKKYKKCCMNKQKIKIVTPADMYIERSLKEYPKEELKLFYEDDVIAIDEKIYQVLKHKAIPIWVDRNYMEETRRNAKNMEEAIELIREKCRKEDINTVKEFDETIAIHYDLDDIINGYFSVLDKTRNVEYDAIQNEKTDFLISIMQIFDIEEEDKRLYIDKIIDRYIEEDYCEEAEKTIDKFLLNFPKMKKYLNIKLSEICLLEGKDIQKTLEPIEEAIIDFKMDEELEIRKIEIYYEYVLLDYYEDEKQEIEIYNKLWKLVKDFIYSRNIKSEEEYNKKQEVEYYFSNILYRIEKFYQNNCVTYIKERMKFLKEALNLIELENESKEILISGLTQNYCDMEDEKEALNIINNFIKQFPNNSNATLIKSNIYSEKENPEYEKAIKVIEEALKNDKIDSKYTLFSKLALLYDESGNDEKATEYQKLARQIEDDDLPF